MDLALPQSLARLPRGGKPDSKACFGDVSVVRDGVKKRRREICAAVDGDSVGIYEIQNGTIVASHPVPPTSSFFGTPYSLVDPREGRVYRRTVCALKRPSLHIRVFEANRADPNKTVTRESPPLREQHSAVRLLDVVERAGRTQVVVVQDHGDVTILSEALSESVLQTSLCPSSGQQMQVLAAQHLTLAEAQRSVLRPRPDLLVTASPETSYLVAVYRGGQGPDLPKDLSLGIWALTPGAPKTLPTLNPIVDHSLSRGDEWGEDVSLGSLRCQFGPLASRLSIRSDSKFAAFELTGLAPVPTSFMHSGVNTATEMMAISPAFAICSSQDLVWLYDLQYHSVQARIDTRRTGAKRKRSRGASNGQGGPMEFIAFFPHASRVIARRRQQLLGIDVSAKDPSRDALGMRSKLLHNLGRGVALTAAGAKAAAPMQQLSIGTLATDTDLERQWHPTRQRLDRAAQAGDVGGFEATVVEDIQTSCLAHSVFSPTLDELPVTRLDIPDFKFDYLLRKIFALDDHAPLTAPAHAPPARGIKVQLASFRMIRWLCRLSLLSARRVQRAFAAANVGGEDTLAVDAVPRALLAADPGRTLLLDCLETGFSTYVDEHAATVRVLLDDALAEVPASSGTDVDEGAVAMSPERQMRSLATAHADPAKLPAELQRALVVSLEHLGAAAGSRISQWVRQSFTQTQVLALVQFLRQQLFQGGHTRSFHSVPVAESDTDRASSTVSLHAIMKLLSSCIDAIGPVGFFGAVDNEEFIGNIVPDLVTEISHAKQSLEDATELQGVLRETLRYQESIQKHRGAIPALVAPDQVNERPGHTGEIFALYTEGVEGQDWMHDAGSLPLSLRANNVIDPWKIRKGSGQKSKRSGRHTAMLQQRRKGLYSFERLVL